MKNIGWTNANKHQCQLDIDFKISYKAVKLLQAECETIG